LGTSVVGYLARTSLAEAPDEEDEVDEDGTKHILAATPVHFLIQQQHTS
jgi:hypothetical protein